MVAATYSDADGDSYGTCCYCLYSDILHLLFSYFPSSLTKVKMIFDAKLCRSVLLVLVYVHFFINILNFIIPLRTSF